jgi:hypothetical protein
MLSVLRRSASACPSELYRSVAQAVRGSSQASHPRPEPVEPYEQSDVSTIRIVRKRGSDVIKDPLFNKGTGFPAAERERLGLRGLLPPRCLTIQEQESRVLTDYYEGLDYVPPEEVENWHISRCALHSVRCAGRLLLSLAFRRQVRCAGAAFKPLGGLQLLIASAVTSWSGCTHATVQSPL